MNHRILVAIVALVAGPALAGAAGASAPSPSAPGGRGEMRAFLVRDGREIQAPFFSEKSASLPVAQVDNEVITLQQLTDALGMAHQGRHEGATKQHDFRPVLDRLIDLKLCVLEAREMGLEDLPDVKKAIQAEEESELIGRVRARAVRSAKADLGEVDRLFRDAVREWKLRSLLFEKEADAKAFQAALQGGKDFVTLGKQLLSDKKAKGTTEAGFSGAGAMLPQVREAVANAKEGASTVLAVKEGWSVIQVIGTRYPANPEARARAEARGLEAARDRAARRYYLSLQKKDATIDEKLLKALDFEAAKPGFAALEKDPRPVARIAGEKPFTVADLASGLGMKFFHGMESPIKEHRVNAAKYEVFETLLRKRLVLKEARRLGVARSQDYLRHMAEFRDATLFAAYVERSIMPDVKVSEDEGRAYYATHKGEFTTPAVYKLESLTFAAAKDAQATLDKLRSGTDFKWLRANAPGQVKEAERVAQLDGAAVSANALPPGLRAQLAGARPGDYRLDDVEGQYYVVRVVSATQPQEQPYVEARAAIGKKLIGENLQKAVKDSAAKLRKAHAVTVYLTKIGF